MKKILGFIIVIFVVNTSYSQIYIGAKAGLNMNSVSAMPSVDEFTQSKDNISDFVPKLGANGGLVFQFKFNKSWVIQPEIVYNGKGLKAKIDKEYEDTSLTGKWDYSLHYFEIPLVVKYVLGAGSSFGPYLELGGYYGYLISGNYQEYIKYGERILIDESRDIDDSFALDGVRTNRHEFGFKVGLGAEFNVNGAVMFVGLRYSRGLTDILEYEVKPDKYEKTYNQVFQLSVAYLFETSSDETKVYYY